MNLLNRALIRLFGHRLGLIQVAEYPKCGGSWVARLIRSYIGIDRKYGITAPVRRHAVVQTHQLFTPHYRHNIVVIRDPRDVWVSFYFHERYLEGSASLYGFDDEKSHAENLLSCMRQKLTDPGKSTPWFSYADFLNSWQGRQGVVWVKYENLQADTAGELTRMIREMGMNPIPDRIAYAVDANRFEKISGREPGQEDVTSHKRKGIVGDWKNYFTQEMGKLVHEHQPFLYELGYEKDASWLKELPK
ncbi:MAG: sulfotransferase domain-containing protein [Kiritimatiellia bacterium]